jgi:hypothetical protein
VIFASGLKYVGVGTTALGWTLCVVALAGGGYWLARVRPWQNGRMPALAADGAPPQAVGNGERAAPASGHTEAPPGGHRPAEPEVRRTGEPDLDNDSAAKG